MNHSTLLMPVLQSQKAGKERAAPGRPGLLGLPLMRYLLQELLLPGSIQTYWLRLAGR